MENGQVRVRQITNNQKQSICHIKVLLERHSLIKNKSRKQVLVRRMVSLR